MEKYDVVIVGGGAAGLSAALVLLRARRSVAVIDAGSPRNAPAAHMQGFLSRDGAPPASLLAAGREELAKYGGSVIQGTVSAITASQNQSQVSRLYERAGFTLSLGDGREYGARRVLVSTGLRDEILDLPGTRARWGRDVLHCPYCHGYEVRDEPIGVLGGNPESVGHALLIAQWTDDLVYFPHTHALTDAERELLELRGIRIADGQVARMIIEADRLTGVELADGTRIHRTAVFVRPRMRPNGALLAELGCETDEQGWVRRDGGGQTTVRGLYVAGNAADPRAQVITAAGQGSATAIAMNADLVDEELAALTQLPSAPVLPPTKGSSMSNTPVTPARDALASTAPMPVPPPSKHQMALMIWIAVFPTLTVLNLLLGNVLGQLPMILRTLVLVTIAVPIVIYGLMPQLHRIRRALVLRNSAVAARRA